MIYYKKGSNFVTKYDVVYDKEKLIELRDEIINKCSLVTIENEKTHNIENNNFEFYERRNVNKKLVEIKDKDYYDQKIYSITYEKYLYPSIVIYINQIIQNDDVDALQKLINKDDMSNRTLYSKACALALKKFNETPMSRFDEKKAALDRLQELMNNKDNNDDKEAVLPYYYDKVMNLFKFDEVDKAFSEELVKVLKFMEIDTNVLTKKIRN